MFTGRGQVVFSRTSTYRLRRVLSIVEGCASAVGVLRFDAEEQAMKNFDSRNRRFVIYECCTISSCRRDEKMKDT